MSAQKTPLRTPAGRSAGKPRATTSGITWEDPSAVPGAVLPPEVARRLSEQLRAIDECQRRARVSARSYYIR